MKKHNLIRWVKPLILAFIMSVAIAACTKQEPIPVDCTIEYVYPTLNFKIINKTDFTIPVYSVDDINIYVKNYNKKFDTINPVLNASAGKYYFSFKLRGIKELDTCYIKIGDLKLDTIVYTIATPNIPCSQPNINTVKVNNLSSVKISAGTIVEI